MVFPLDDGAASPYIRDYVMIISVSMVQNTVPDTEQVLSRWLNVTLQCI